MKIILSPSKTRNYNINFNSSTTLPKYLDDANHLAKIIKGFSRENIKRIMKISDKILDSTYDDYQNFNTNEGYPVILTYTGQVFRGIEVESYTDQQLSYLSNHLRVLSALYGELKPFDLIKPYRLDMGMKILDSSLYKFWDKKIDYKDELIINLASSEFSKMVTSSNIVTIEFKERKGDQYKTIGTYAKMARGKMVDHMVKNRVEDLDRIKQFKLDNYQFNGLLSDDKNLIFSR